MINYYVFKYNSTCRASSPLLEDDAGKLLRAFLNT